MAISTCMLAAVAANGLTVSRVQSWKTDGWPGRDNPGLAAIDNVAASMTAKGLHAAAIGYEIEFEAFMATFHAADSRCKVGNYLDLVLLTRHGITIRTRAPRARQARMRIVSSHIQNRESSKSVSSVSMSHGIPDCARYIPALPTPSWHASTSKSESGWTDAATIPAVRRLATAPARHVDGMRCDSRGSR